MIASLGLILLCQLAGEVIVRGLGLPMPGPVVGLLFLLLLLLARDRFVALARGPLQQDGVENASRGLLARPTRPGARRPFVGVSPILMRRRIASLPGW
jgi:holin-like protein